MNDPHDDAALPRNDSHEADPAPLDVWNASPDETTALEMNAVNDPDDEILTAYLDGELSEEELSRIEERLDRDPALSARLDKLRTAGKLLESLETIPLNERLTASTMEMLSAFVQREIKAERKKQTRRHLIALAIFAAVGALAFLIGSFAVGRLWPPHRAASEKDMPIVARLESLEIVGDYEFLTALNDAKLFAEENSARPVPDGGSTDKTSEKTPDKQSKKMPVPSALPPQSAPVRPPDQTEMFLLNMRFQRLTGAEKKKYRKLYRQIDLAPNRNELLTLLDLVGRWFWYDLHETERYAYWQTPSSERLAEIKRLRSESDRPANSDDGSAAPPIPGGKRGEGGPFAPADRRPSGFTRGGKESRRGGYPPRDLRPSLPTELRGERLDDIGDELFTFARKNYKDGFGDKKKEEILFEFISERGVDSFVNRLSDAGKTYLATMDEEQKIRLIGLLILVELHEKQFRMRVRDDDRSRDDLSGPNRAPNDRAPNNRMPNDRTPPPGRYAGPDTPNAGFYWKTESTRELAETLKKLPQAKRDELLSLPDEEMYSQLLILHWGFDPKQGTPPAGPSKGGDRLPPGNRGERWEKDVPRENPRENPRAEPSDQKRDNPRNEMPEPTDSWKRFLDEKKGSAQPSAVTSAPDPT